MDGWIRRKQRIRMDKDRMDDWSRGLIVAVAVAVKDGWMDRKQRSREGGMDG